MKAKHKSAIERLRKAASQNSHAGANRPGLLQIYFDYSAILYGHTEWMGL